MKRRYFVIICAVIMLCTAVNTVPAAAEEGSGSAVKLGISAGPLFYGLIGPKSVSAGLLRIKFDKDSFKAGAYAGIDLLFYPSDKHSLSLGLSYEMRRIDLRIVDLKIFGMAQVLSGILPFIPSNLFNLAYLLPVEKLVGVTSLSEHYLIVPLTYRFYFHKNLYLGLGADIAVLVNAHAEYSVMAFGVDLDLKPYLAPVDLGARIAGGFTVKGFYGEVSAGIGLMDFDKLNGVRRSVYLKAMLGYRFF